MSKDFKSYRSSKIFDYSPSIHLEIGKDSFAIKDLPKMIADSVYPYAFPETDNKTQNTDFEKDEKICLKVI